MHKPTAPVVVATVLLAVPIAFIAYATRSTYKQLYAQFPEFDHKVVRKTYRKLTGDALSGQLDMTDWSPEKFDANFRFECYELQFAN